jgi:magnesium chelatase family protein
VLAANPCPCGQAIGSGLRCTCTSLARRRYLGKLSGPLLDRVDVQVEVPAVRRSALRTPGESTATVAARVLAARTAQRERWHGTGWALNAEVPGRVVRDRLGPGRALLSEIDAGIDQGTITLRGADRVLRLAWTLADLAGRPAPGRVEIGRALLLRNRGQA